MDELPDLVKAEKIMTDFKLDEDGLFRIQKCAVQVHYQSPVLFKDAITSSTRRRSNKLFALFDFSTSPPGKQTTVRSELDMNPCTQHGLQVSQLHLRSWNWQGCLFEDAGDH